MKLYLRFVLLLTFFTACQTDSTKDSNNSSGIKHHTVIFLDKSASLGADTTYTAQKYEEQIRLLLQNHVQKAGDRIEVFYVHDNTLKGKCLDLIAQTPALETAGLNATDLESAQLDFSLQIGKERKNFEKKIKGALQQTNEDASKHHTDLLATLALLNERNTGDVQLTAYYLSDMLESTSQGLDFHQKKPNSPEEAKKWASEEAEKFKGVNLQGISIILISPFNPLTNAEKNDPKVSLFWTTLFENLGALSVEEF